MVIEGCKCGRANCHGMCSYSVGRRLAKFIKGLDGEKTEIGNISPIKSNGTDLICTGISLYTKGDIGNVMLPISSVSIPIESRFKSYMDERPMALLRAYINKNDFSAEERAGLIDKFKNIEKGKFIPVPIKPGVKCLAKAINESGVSGKKEIRVSTFIQCVEYKLNREKRKMEYTVTTGVTDNIGSKQLKFDIEEYGKRLWLVDTESSHIKKDITDPLVHITTFGIIQPIEIVSNTGSIIVDNEGAYYKGVNGKPIEMIAIWNNRTLQLQDKEYKKNKMFLELKRNEDYIYKHRKYIAPYGLVDTHIVNMK